MRSAVISVLHASDGIRLLDAQLSRLQSGCMDRKAADVIVLGEEIDLEALRHIPCARIVVCRSEAFSIGQYDSELAVKVICELWESHGYDVLFFTEGDAETELAARVGFRIGGSTVIDVDRFMHSAGTMIVGKGVYSSNLRADFEMLRKPFVIHMAKGARVSDSDSDSDSDFDARAPETILVDVAPIHPNWLSDVVMENVPTAHAFETAKVIVVGGRGVFDREGLARLEALATVLEGVLGATRPVVMNGWIDESKLVGISGRVIHPDVCFAFGVSGSMPFIAGVTKSKILVAINNDPTAAIFRNCDVGVIEDLKPMVEELIKQIESIKKDKRDCP